MKKKFYGALLLGSLFLAGGMVSCSDYDDDINSLNERVDALEKTVAELQKAIEAGAVITNVQSTENGVTVTLSDGKTFEVKNGAKGEDGEDGSVIEIKQVDGVDYWFLDGKNTGYPVKGEKGDDGNDGNDGSDGVDGKDGCWYFPNTDGYWHKQYYNEEGEIVDEATDQPWIPSAKETVRVVYDSVNGRLLISNAEGMQEGEVLVIETWGELKSLAVIPYVIDKETSMPVVSFYNIVKDGEVLESTDATAHFRLNPNNASIEGWDWSIIDRKAVTRAEGDNVNDLLAINEISRGDGEMIVSLKSKKSIADLNEDEIAIFALNGTNTANGNNIASDYAKVTSEDLKNFAIVNESMPREFVTKYVYPTTEPDVLTGRNDAELVYDKSIDLNTLTYTWAKDIDSYHGVMLEDLDIDGLTYEFSKPEEYLAIDGKTNQQEFVNLNGSTVTVSDDYTTAAIGRTPIFLAKALVNGTVVATGYIKLNIVESAPAEDLEPITMVVDCGTLYYQDLVAGKTIKGLDWKVVNQFYSEYSLTAETFNTHYKNPTDANTKVEEKGVTITNNWWGNSTGTTTDAVLISMDPTNVEVIGKENIERNSTLTFESIDKKNYPDIIVKFTYQIVDNVEFPDLNPDYRVGDANMVEVKGRMVGDKWTMISGIKEHFENYLTNWNVPANHTKFYTTLEIGQNGATITGTDYKDQEIKLTSELTSEYKDYIVVKRYVLLNNEEKTETYTVRFRAPFTIAIDPIALKTLPAEASSADLKNAVIIYGPKGKNEIIFANGVETSNAATYKFASSGYTITYDLTGSDTDSWESFGGNLVLDPSTITTNGTITWDNDGAVLQSDKKATSHATLTVPNVVEISGTGVVTILSSANSTK